MTIPGALRNEEYTFVTMTHMIPFMGQIEQFDRLTVRKQMISV